MVSLLERPNFSGSYLEVDETIASREYTATGSDCGLICLRAHRRTKRVCVRGVGGSVALYVYF